MVVVNNCKRYYFVLCLFFSFSFLNVNFAQQFDADYFLGSISVDQDIPDPAEILGYSPGDWHSTHAEVNLFMENLAQLSDRVEIVDIGISHGNRPMKALLITSPQNHNQLENLRRCHLASVSPNEFSCEGDAFNPLVLYQAYTSHGNEPSGTNAALLYSWYLAASTEPWVEEILSETVVIVDACMNPDGYDRFVNWVNSRRSIGAMVVDPNDDEFNEPWPRSRTNHYWFDLNRDWLPVQHPESIGKIRLFQSWKPNVLTDHHEMGSNATYFFQPGVPSRTNPMTPAINQELTASIAEFHAGALDGLQVPYYTKERFDDYYYGKGSTYPDIQGCVGILFEQASSRGHAQQTQHGELAFTETIRNQLVTSISTLKGAWELKNPLLDYQVNFFQDAVEEGDLRESSGFVLPSGEDVYRLEHFVQMLLTHDISVYRGQEGVKPFYYVPFKQGRYNLVRAIFETVHDFSDSLFYDVSTWTIPMAFGLNVEEGSRDIDDLQKMDYEEFVISNNYQPIDDSGIAYLFEWSDFKAPSMLNKLHKDGIKTKVAFSDFVIATNDGDQSFSKGSILILPGIQDLNNEELHRRLERHSKETGIRVFSASSGLSLSGIDLGSPSFRMLSPTKILMVTGDGVSSYSAGEIWYYFDRHQQIPITKVHTNRLNRVNLDNYEVVIMPSTWNFSGSENFAKQLKSYLSSGKTLILQGSASRWAIRNKLSNAEIINLKSGPDSLTSYSEIGQAYGAYAVGGCILEGRADLNNPLFFGYQNELFNVFKRKSWALEIPENNLAAPLTYTNSPLLSGYLHTAHEQVLSGKASIMVESSGGGRIVHLSDGTFFRGYWYGTAQILSNAVYFGSMIDRRATK